MYKFQKWGQPRLDKNDVAVSTQYALHFGKSLLEIVRQGGEMVEAALDDEYVFAEIGEGKFAAIGDRALRWAFVLFEETRREVHAFDVGEAETLKGDQAVAAAAKKFDDFGVARPLTGAQTIEACEKLLNFLFGLFKTQVGGLPGVGS